MYQVLNQPGSHRVKGGSRGGLIGSRESAEDDLKHLHSVPLLGSQHSGKTALKMVMLKHYLYLRLIGQCLCHVLKHIYYLFTFKLYTSICLSLQCYSQANMYIFCPYVVFAWPLMKSQLAALKESIRWL